MTSPRHPNRLRAVCLAATSLLAAALCGCSPGEEADPAPAPAAATGRGADARSAEKAPRAREATPAADPDEAAPAFVGRAVCAECHAREDELWRGSHHDLAMQVARDDSVLGDFDGTTFTHQGSTSTFTRRDGAFRVRTDGPDGEVEEFEVAWAFGVDPLQQYLVRLPDGRVQALGVAWDTRPAEQGGQRWFHLYPDEALAAGDPLHWTGIQQNWNHMCAECHSTGVRKRYSAEDDRFDTTWSEIDVACEACHGPGSAHVAWARVAAGKPQAAAARPQTAGGANGLAVVFGDGEVDGGRGRWVFADGAPIAHRVPARRSDVEVETCGRCHARRALLREADPAGQPLLDTHRVALLEAGLYETDGQIADEVYVYGSFLQSRMHAAGVTCSDCHDAHSLALVETSGPDAVCAGCHRSEVFASTGHHGHPADSAGARCVACHMPERTYMEVDPRRDHGFRVPRPDLAAKLGGRDVCTGCHVERDAEWAAAAVESWTGHPPPARPHFGEALHAARRRAPGAADALGAVVDDPGQPAIVRATALQELGSLLRARDEARLAAALDDGDPLVRLGALAACEGLPPAARLRRARPLLRDPVLAVRLEAERVLRAVPPALWRPADRLALADVQAEWSGVHRLNADRPESWLGAGLLRTHRGDLTRARHAYERALEIEPRFVPALVNLADLEREAGRDEIGEVLLLRAVQIAPENADVQHALGLLRVRRGERGEALSALERAARLAPDRPRYSLVYALALESEGRADEAIRILEDANGRFPEDTDLLYTLATLHRDRGERERAIAYAKRLVALAPGATEPQQLLESLQRRPPAGRPGS